MKQKKYTTEKEIIRRIDSLTLKMNTKSIEGEEFRRQSKEHYRQCADDKLSEGDIRHLKTKGAEFADKADKCERSAFRIQNIALPKMKRTLAAFRTGTLPIDGIKDDVSVVEQK